MEPGTSSPRSGLPRRYPRHAEATVVIVLSLLLAAAPGLGMLPGRVVGEEQVPLAITLTDVHADHVHEAGSAVTVDVMIEGSGTRNLRYQWRDFQGNALTPVMSIAAGVTQRIRAPDGAVGYYGLAFLGGSGTVALPQRRVGEDREYGFVVLPYRDVAAREADRHSSFGVVHARLSDPHLPPWVKTLTWKTLDWRDWGAALQKRRNAGVVELPLVLGREWRSDDAAPVPASQLDRLEARIAHYFSQAPDVLFWELGLEENLQRRFRRANYWSNLAAKSAAVRRAAQRVNPEVKLIYQIAELDLAPLRGFVRSEAARSFDILSLHPYAWPDFPTPERWLHTFIASVRQLLSDAGLGHMPIWFTEIGVPQHGNHVDGFFGYPDSGRRVTGQLPHGVVAYLIKAHVLALNQGVAKVFWYNYQDRSPEREQAENHFGLRDFWGYPKPAYAAYVNLHHLLDQRRPGAARRLPGDVWAYPFHGPERDVLVVWVEPGGERELALSALVSTPQRQVLNAVGTPQELVGDALNLSSSPLFVITATAGKP